MRCFLLVLAACAASPPSPVSPVSPVSTSVDQVPSTGQSQGQTTRASTDQGLGETTPDSSLDPFHAVSDIDWSSDGGKIAVIDSHLSARVYTPTGRRLGASTYIGEGSAQVAIHFNAAADEVRVGNMRWRLHDDRRTPLTLIRPENDRPGTPPPALSPDWSASVETVGPDLFVLDTATGQVRQRWPGLSDGEAATDLATPEGPLLVCGETALTVASVAGQPARRLAAPSGQRWAYYSCAISPQGTFAAVAMNQGGFVLVDIAAAQVVGSLGTARAGSALRASRFTRDGSRVLTFEHMAGDHRVDMYEVATRRSLGSAVLGDIPTDYMHFTPTADRVVSWAWEGPVVVHELATGTELRRIDVEGHPWAALSPTGEEVAIGDGRSLEVYNVASGTRLAKWTIE